MLLRPCILQYIIDFPGSRRNSPRPLDAAQTMYFTIYDSLSWVLEELPETARCCPDDLAAPIMWEWKAGPSEYALQCPGLRPGPIGPNIMPQLCRTLCRRAQDQNKAFLGLGGTPQDRSMLPRPCILHYIIHFPGSRRNSSRPLDAAQTVYFTIYYSLSRVWETLPETARCCSDRVFYNTLLAFPGLGGTPRDRSMLLRPCILQYH